jgi:hypothetical protein
MFIYESLKNYPAQAAQAAHGWPACVHSPRTVRSNSAQTDAEHCFCVMLIMVMMMIFRNFCFVGVLAYFDMEFGNFDVYCRFVGLF